eukprot:g76104.t1
MGGGVEWMPMSLDMQSCTLPGRLYLAFSDQAGLMYTCSTSSLPPRDALFLTVFSRYWMLPLRLIASGSLRVGKKHVQGYIPTARDIDKLLQMHRRHLEYIGTVERQGWIDLGPDNRGCALSARG